MSPAETVARVLRDNLPDDEPMWSLIVIAKEVVAALGLRQEHDCFGYRRYVTDWHEVGE